jgi:hypothetical protein
MPKRHYPARGSDGAEGWAMIAAKGKPLIDADAQNRMKKGKANHSAVLR